MPRRRAAILPGFSAQDEALAFALAAGANQTTAAKHAGVTDRTVRNKLKDPAFVALVRQLRDKIRNQTVGLLTASSVEAATSLRKLLKSKDEATIVSAAKAILAGVVRLGQFDELASRLAAVEELLKARGGPDQ
jgi:hypothetical protein